MAFSNSQNARVLYGASAIASTIRNVKPTYTAAMIEVSTIADTSHQFIGGLGEWGVAIDGVFDTTTGAGSILNEITTPISTSATMFIGGVVRWIVDKRVAATQGAEPAGGDSGPGGRR